MRKLILHIGRHKTGTTAIQRFLYGNPELLRANGYCYPDHGAIGFGHHDIAGALIKKNMELSEISDNEAVNKIRELIAGLVKGKKGIPIISSEAFQNCDPKLVRAALSAYEVNVIVYLREPVSYLLSSYTQKVHATNYTGTVEQYTNSTPLNSYKQFIKEWSDAFGSNVYVHIYSRDHLLKRDIVLDFCESALGIDHQIVSALYQSSSTNKSLSNSLLRFKLWVNQFDAMKESHSRLLYVRLEELALTDKSGPVLISDELIKDIEDRTTSGNNEISIERFSRPLLFEPYSKPPVGSCGRVGFEDIALVRKNLITLEPCLAQSLPRAPQLAKSYRLGVNRFGSGSKGPKWRNYVKTRKIRSTGENYTWNFRKGLIKADIHRPTIDIDYPLHGRIVAGRSSFSGTSSDAGESGFKFVRICVYSHDLGQWYNFESNTFSSTIGNGATAARLTNTTKNSTDWSCVVSLPVGSYSVRVKAFNNAGNNSPWELKRFSVVSDLRCPEVTIENPLIGSITTKNRYISGFAFDNGGSGFRFVRLCIRDKNTNQWFNFDNEKFGGAVGNGAVSAVLSNTSKNSTSWSYKVCLPIGDYSLGVRVFNNEGMASAWIHTSFTVVETCHQSFFKSKDAASINLMDP